jgi:hypothetical protein
MPCENGISPTLLVFGTTRLPDERFLLPKQLDRLIAMMKERVSYEKILACRRFENRLRHAPQVAANCTILSGIMAYVYWERPKRAGPVPVLHRNGSIYLLKLMNSPNLSSFLKSDQRTSMT